MRSFSGRGSVPDHRPRPAGLLHLAFVMFLAAPSVLVAGEGTPVSAAGLTAQGRSAGAFGAGVELTCSVPYVPFLWGGAGAGLDTKTVGMWNVEGGLATLVRGKGTVLTASMGTGSQGAYVGASVPIMLGAEESQEGSSYLSPYARVYAWEAKPDVVVGLTWKRILTMPGLSRLF